MSTKEVVLCQPVRTPIGAFRVHLVAGLDDVAEHGGADKLRGQASAFHCCPNHGGAKLRGRDGLQ